MVSLVSGTKQHDYFIWKTVVWHTVTGKMLSGTKQLQSTEPLSGRICLEQNILSTPRPGAPKINSGNENHGDFSRAEKLDFTD